MLRQDQENSIHVDLTHPVRFDVPLQIRNNSGKAFSGPISVADEGSVKLTFQLESKLSNATVQENVYTLVIRAAARGFEPMLRFERLNEISVLQSQEGDKTFKLYKFHVPRIEKLHLLDLKFSAIIPTSAAAGQWLCLRPELWLEDVMFEYGFPHQIRVSPQLPPAEGTAQDVIIFAGLDMMAEDFLTLEQACQVMKRRPFFVDCEHFGDSSGFVDVEKWKGHVGKATI
eukprot:91656-Hanusia_phi.AAC.1